MDSGVLAQAAGFDARFGELASKERTFWRDARLSARHRLWGYDCPAIDLDFVMVEYNSGEPSAIVEYKNEYAPVQYNTHPSYKALVSLGNSSGIPVLAARYSTDFSTWTVTPLNEAAKSLIAQRSKMSEEEWVRILYGLRGLSVPEKVIEDIRGNSVELL